MQDRFEARLQHFHKQQRQYDNTGKELKAYFEANPRRAAQALLHSLPAQLDAWREHAVSRFGVDLEDREQRKAKRWANVAEAWEYTLLAIKYDTHDNALSYMTMLRDTEETGERLARLVCAAFLLAWSKIPGMAAATIEAFTKASSHVTNEAGLEAYLTSYVVIHTSMWANRKLRAGIDELREEGESPFNRLLKELPAEVAAAYDEMPRDWGDLMDLRTEAVRPLEKQGPPTKKTELAELATGVDEEKLMQQAKAEARAAGLSPQEREFFELFTARRMTPTQVAAEKGVTPEGAVPNLQTVPSLVFAPSSAAQHQRYTSSG
jgi:hypothetical protein